jgi:YidC/Oxa1 family membrane protein insertase
VSAVPVLASTIGQIFQPLFQAMAWLIAFFYALIPNYAVAIALLTVVVMIVTAPLTVKSTRSMAAMQRLAPELKKLQAKYKGDKQTLNDEMMKLYKEHGVNPVGGCLPMLIQFPAFIILYDVIKGLTNTVKKGQLYSTKPYPNKTCTQAVCAAPRYISHSTKLYTSLRSHNGSMPAFGINLASKMLGHHTVLQALPYACLILVAIALQYLSMRQINNRNPQAAQANPQAQMMQRYMPLLFAVIYINIAAGVNVYFIVSSLCRMGLQQAAFRWAPQKATEEVLPASGGSGGPARRRTLMERLADAQKRALEQQETQKTRRSALEQEAEGLPPAGGDRPSSKRASPPAKSPPSGKAPPSSKEPGSNAALPADKRPAASVPPPRSAPEGDPSGGGQTSSNGRTSSNGARPKPQNQSRSKAKRGRKAR